MTGVTSLSSAMGQKVSKTGFKATFYEDDILPFYDYLIHTMHSIQYSTCAYNNPYISLTNVVTYCIYDLTVCALNYVRDVHTNSILG
jgi:hypothetical protein